MNTEEQLKAHACLRVVQDLDPYVVDGVLRVGGHLRNSQLSASTKHPILLPSNHHVTDLLILHHHCQEENGQFAKSTCHTPFPLQSYRN